MNSFLLHKPPSFKNFENNPQEVMPSDSKVIRVFTDGSFQQEKLKASWSFVCVSNKVTIKSGEVTHKFKGQGATVSELTALYEAVKFIKTTLLDKKVEIYSDCLSLINLIKKFRANKEGLGQISWMTDKLKMMFQLIVRCCIPIEYIPSGKSFQSFHGIAHCLASSKSGARLKKANKAQLKELMDTNSIYFDNQFFPLIDLSNSQVQ